MQDIEKKLREEGFKEYNVYMIKQMSGEILEDFVKSQKFTNVAIINLSCPCHPEYKIFYRILH